MKEIKMSYYDVKAVSDMLSESSKLEGKTLLWTGTGGFLGQWVLQLIKHLNQNVLKVPCKLLAYDMAIPPQSVQDEFSNCGIYFNSHDLTTKLAPVVERVDYVVHMAGIASPTHYKRKPLETIDVAIEGVRSALDIAKHHGAKFLFTSSSEVYQTPDVIPTPETYVGAIPSNTERSCYDVSKLMAENLVYVYSHNYGVNGCSVRIFNSFGVGISEADSRILPRIASAAKSKNKIKIYKTNILPTRTYCPTANTIAGVFKALLNGESSQIYNIGISSPEISVNELIEMANEICGLDVQYEYVAPTSVYVHEPLRRCPDISKAMNEIGYNPSVSLSKGLVDFFHWTDATYAGIDHQ
jgi:UDP-glucuronate decarboxylase